MTKISLTQRTYDALKDYVVTGRLAPGTALNIREMAAQMDVSSGAVREALSRLSAERLVVTERRGFTVAPITIEEVADLGRTRALVESEALRRAIEIGDEAWAEGAQSAMRQLKATPMLTDGPYRHMNHTFLIAYEDFFTALFAACDRIWLNRVQSWLSSQSSRTRYLAEMRPRAELSSALGQLEDILEATLKRDADRAAALLQEHMLTATERVIEYLGPTAALTGARSLTPVDRGAKPRAAAKPRAKRAGA